MDHFGDLLCGNADICCEVLMCWQRQQLVVNILMLREFVGESNHNLCAVWSFWVETSVFGSVCVCLFAVLFYQGRPESSAGSRGCNHQHSWAAASPSLAPSSRSGLLSAGLKFVKGDYVCHGKWVRQWARFLSLFLRGSTEKRGGR